MKLYVIRRIDFWEAIAGKMIPEGRISEAGTLWITLFLTPEEKAKYTFPISEA